METQDFSLEKELKSVVVGIHRLVKIMNFLTSFPEKTSNLAAKQKMDAQAMLNDITVDARQLKVILSHYQQEVAIPNLNMKQNEMEEFIESFETETDSKTSTTKKKRTNKTTPSTSGMKTRLRTLTEMAKEIARREKESTHIKDLVSMADVVEALTHSVALTSAMDRRFSIQSAEANQIESDSVRRATHIESHGTGPTDHVESDGVIPTNQSEPDRVRGTTQIESNSTGPSDHVESDGVIATNQSESDSYRNVNLGDSGSTCKTIHQVQSGRNSQSSDTPIDDIRPIYYVQSDIVRPTQSKVISKRRALSEGDRPTQNSESNGVIPSHQVQSHGVRSTQNIESNGVIPIHQFKSDSVRFTRNIESNGVIPMHQFQSDRFRFTRNIESNGKPIRNVRSCFTSMSPDSVPGQATVLYSDTSPTTTYSKILKYMNIIQRHLKLQLLQSSGGSIFKLFLLTLLIILTALAIFMQYCFYSNKDRCLCVQYLLSSFVDISCCPSMVL